VALFYFGTTDRPTLGGRPIGHGGLHMTLLGVLLVVNAVLHGLIVVRYGIKGNEPPAVFGVVYALLALAVFFGWSYALPATLAVTTLGLIGLAVNFKKLQHDTTIEKVIFVVGAALLAYTAYLLWLA
jgi:hypothetical protein